MNISVLLIPIMFISLSAMAQERIVYTAVPDADGVQRVEIMGGEYYYKPDHIVVKINVPVELIIKKAAGIVPHNIVIHQPEAGIEVKESMSTKQKIIRFTPIKAGTFSFFCDKKLLFFKSHKERGMEGILEVIE
jgi:plastocyanin domain-containing protein